MDLLTKQSKTKLLVDYYNQPEQIQKTHDSVKWFLMQILWYSDKAAKDETLSIYDIYTNNWLSDFAIFEDENYLLSLLNYLLSKNKSEQESWKYVHIQNEKYKNIYIQDLNTQSTLKSENISDIYIQIEWLQKINEILWYINNYYQKNKPSLLRFLDNRIKENLPEIIKKWKIGFDLEDDLQSNNIQKLILILKEILFLSNDQNLKQNNKSFVKKSVYGGYMLMFYVFSHLKNSDVFMNRNRDFGDFWDNHLVKDAKILSSKEKILPDYIWFGESMYRECTIKLTSKLPEYQLIWNTKTTNSAVKKLQTNREYGFADTIKDLARATVIWHNRIDLTKLINNKHIYFKNQKIKFDIKDKWSATKILQTAKANNIILDKEFEKSLQWLIVNPSKKRDTVWEWYQEIKFMIENKNWSSFELKFMTKDNFEKGKISEDASEYIYKYMDQMKLKNRWEKILTKEYILEFWKRKIIKDKDKNSDDNIIKKIYWEYNQKNIKKFLTNICNKINKSYKAIIIDSKIWYINKNEKTELEKYNYIPETIDISADQKYKIYPHYIIARILEIFE